ncbi:hypothetical protein EPUS_02343 [Endocarpon pusillum Z07020]|uniref:Peptidase A1 domain-containing protein n=1 Tax=Endocarpon pusillum (strain Z07020 / HMAS-L-300199) TaxID=1263415 RepID=U1GGB9_ENDPU|nr:uncharacterized protein EPUS_02343 [Endocarpon pusillum Z07020]ERF70821.1 hypothetical protein EPUS_02343 [Endocarpon pusillum Z07020]
MLYESTAYTVALTYENALKKVCHSFGDFLFKRSTGAYRFPDPHAHLTSTVLDSDGIDGCWTTFSLHIGTPPQMVRLLPSITGNTIWVVLPRACPNSSPNTCWSDRGNIFTSDQSSTWVDKGLFQLPLNPEHYLPFSGAANYGLENVAVGSNDNGGVSLPHQVVVGYDTEDFYLGALGLSPSLVNISDYTDQYLSLLGTLKKGNNVSSNSYGYTAGASYQLFPARDFGSLTLGGYDSTRMDASKNLTIHGVQDTYQPMRLGIKDIKGGSTKLLDMPIVAALDSIVSQIWLPISACKNFESAFGLVWDSRYELYILNKTQRSILLEKNATITFTLSTGSLQRTDDHLDKTFPYAAFDLKAKPPFAGLNEAVHYFPLKQAANETQYTLGLFPAVFPDYNVEPHLVTINPPEGISDGPDDTVQNVHSTSVWSRTVIICTISGGIIVVLLFVIRISLCVQRNRQEKPAKAAPELSSHWKKAELAGKRLYHSELPSQVVSTLTYELASPIDVQHELASIRELRGWTRSETMSVSNSPSRDMPGHRGGSGTSFGAPTVIGKAVRPHKRAAMRLLLLFLFALTLTPKYHAIAEHHMNRPPLHWVNKRNSNVPLRITNDCDQDIYPAIQTQAGTGPPSTGFRLTPGSSNAQSVSADWQGRVWGRTNCSFNSQGTAPANNAPGQACSTGDCGGTLACRGSGHPPASLAEFTLETGSSQSYYDISLVDGYNLPLGILSLLSSTTNNTDLSNIPPNLTNPICIGTSTLLSPTGAAAKDSTTRHARVYYDISLVDGYNLPLGILSLLSSTTNNTDLSNIPPNLTNPICIGTSTLLSPTGSAAKDSTTNFGTNTTYPLPLEQTLTPSTLLSWCPWDLQLSPPLQPTDGIYPYPDSTIPRPAFNPCFSTCAKYSSPKDCCTGRYNNANTCRPSLYSTQAKKICPDAYSYAFDDQSSTFIIPSGGGFEVVFCPRLGRSTIILNALGRELRELAQRGAVTGEILEGARNVGWDGMGGGGSEGDGDAGPKGQAKRWLVNGWM